MADPQAPRKARITHYYFYDATEDATCPVCGWQGAYGETDREFYEELFDCSCPGCGKMLLIVGWSVGKLLGRSGRHSSYSCARSPGSSV